ncbi:DUF1972 domain-containing protein [Lacticaseibacillus sp. 53-4]
MVQDVYVIGSKGIPARYGGYGRWSASSRQVK